MGGRFSTLRAGTLLCLVGFSAMHGQEAVSNPVGQQLSSPSLQLNVSTQSTLQSYQTEQQALAQSLNALIASGATSLQLQTWQQQNATALANQQQLALNMAAASDLEPQTIVTSLNIPADASLTLKAYLIAQAALANARAQIHNQLLNALPTDVSDAQLGQMRQSEFQLFQQQQGMGLQLQAQRAQVLADASAQQSTALPPPLVLAPGTSPQLAALLIAKDQLMRDQITFANKYASATQAARAAALAQWAQQNATRIQQLQQLALTLSAIPSN